MLMLQIHDISHSLPICFCVTVSSTVGTLPCSPSHNASNNLTHQFLFIKCHINSVWTVNSRVVENIHSHWHVLWLLWTSVHISIIFRQKIYIMEDKTIIVVQLQCFNKSHVHQNALVEWIITWNNKTSHSLQYHSKIASRVLKRVKSTQIRPVVLCHKNLIVWFKPVKCFAVSFSEYIDYKLHFIS